MSGTNFASVSPCQERGFSMIICCSQMIKKCSCLARCSALKLSNEFSIYTMLCLLLWYVLIGEFAEIGISMCTNSV